MRTLVCLVTLFLATVMNGQTSLFTHHNFNNIAAGHNVIAIIPFDASVTLRPKQMKEIPPEQLERMELAEGEAIQTAMHAWFMRRAKQGRLRVAIQDTRTTNALLLQNDITEENIKEFTPQQLCDILQVDALISGTFQTNKPMSEGASLVLGAVFGFFGSTSQAVMNMYVHNADDGTILVNYHKRVEGSLGTTEDQLINRLMRKASRRIAYTD